MEKRGLVEGQERSPAYSRLDHPAEPAVERYRDLWPLYRDFSSAVKFVIEEELATRGIRVHSVEARAKTVESFAEKAMLLFERFAREAEIPDPLREMTDMAGVRIITFFPKTISEVERVIQSEFIVLEKDDKHERLQERSRFGYQSVHYLIKLKANRTDLGEYCRYKDLIAKVQVRTILQHAWAEIEHDIQYKSLKSMPRWVRRRFTALASMLEIADREFQAIHHEDARLKVKKGKDAETT
jgi:putative GTP pyrophosphokinase